MNGSQSGRVNHENVRQMVAKWEPSLPRSGSVELAPPPFPGGLPFIALGRSGDGRPVQGVLYLAGHPDVEQSAAVLPDLQGVQTMAACSGG